MSERVTSYVDLERQLLALRLRRLIAGHPTTADDPDEERYFDLFEGLWNAMSADEHAALHAARERRFRSRPASAAAAPGEGLVVHVRPLAGGVELTFPPGTPEYAVRPAARMARVILDDDALEAFPAGAQTALVENALAFVGARAGEQGALRLIDPETGEVYLTVAPQPSAVAERPETP